MAQRAECVMLNKGPFINEAISMLADILGRMQDHTQKKRSLLRRLRAWDNVGATGHGNRHGEPDGTHGPSPHHRHPVRVGAGFGAAAAGGSDRPGSVHRCRRGHGLVRAGRWLVAAGGSHPDS